MIYGKWTECLWSIDPFTYEAYKKSEKKGGEPKKSKQVRPEKRVRPIVITKAGN